MGTGRFPPSPGLHLRTQGAGLRLRVWAGPADVVLGSDPAGVTARATHFSFPGTVLTSPLSLYLPHRQRTTRGSGKGKHGHVTGTCGLGLWPSHLTLAGLTWLLLP